MKRIVIYHHYGARPCPDGLVAAWVARCRFGDKDTEYVPSQYGDAPPDVTGAEVWILDFSYSRDVLLEMKSKAASLRVIDHHKTARDDLAGLDFCVFDMERSGAAMAWDEFFPLTQRSWLVEYVQDRDLWTWKLPNSKAVNAALGVCLTSIDVCDKTALLSAPSDFVPAGTALLAAQDENVAAICRNAQQIRFDFQNVFCVNCTLYTSEVVGWLAEHSEAGWAVGWYVDSKGKVRVSLRSRKNGPDVSEIAKKFGGGGHAGAAGFEMTLATFVKFMGVEVSL